MGSMKVVLPRRCECAPSAAPTSGHQPRRTKLATAAVVRAARTVNMTTMGRLCVPA